MPPMHGLAAHRVPSHPRDEGLQLLGGHCFVRNLPELFSGLHPVLQVSYERWPVSRSPDRAWLPKASGQMVKCRGRLGTLLLSFRETCQNRALGAVTGPKILAEASDRNDFCRESHGTRPKTLRTPLRPNACT